jgi:hypothetical protein
LGIDHIPGGVQLDSIFKQPLLLGNHNHGLKSGGKCKITFDFIHQ